MAEMINSESKRLARMIQTFLDVERLSDGQMDLRTIRSTLRMRRRGVPGTRAPARRAEADRITGG